MGTVKTVTSQKNPTMGLKPLSRLDSLKFPGSEGTHKETVEHRDSRGMYSNLYKNKKAESFFFSLCDCVAAEDSFTRK